MKTQSAKKYREGWPNYINPTLEQRQSSELRIFVDNGQQMDQEFRDYFFRIDADCKEFVDWNPLVRYFMRKIGFGRLRLSQKSLSAIQKTMKGVIAHEVQHREKSNIFSFARQQVNPQH
jgi:hypothetical protein